MVLSEAKKNKNKKQKTRWKNSRKRLRTEKLCLFLLFGLGAERGCVTPRGLLKAQS